MYLCACVRLCVCCFTYMSLRIRLKSWWAGVHLPLAAITREIRHFILHFHAKTALQKRGFVFTSVKERKKAFLFIGRHSYETFKRFKFVGMTPRGGFPVPALNRGFFLSLAADRVLAPTGSTTQPRINRLLKLVPLCCENNLHLSGKVFD